MPSGPVDPTAERVDSQRLLTRTLVNVTLQQLTFRSGHRAGGEALRRSGISPYPSRQREPLTPAPRDQRRSAARSQNRLAPSAVWEGTRASSVERALGLPKRLGVSPVSPLWGVTDPRGSARSPAARPERPARRPPPTAITTTTVRGAGRDLDRRRLVEQSCTASCKRQAPGRRAARGCADTRPPYGIALRAPHSRPAPWLTARSRDQSHSRSGGANLSGSSSWQPAPLTVMSPSATWGGELGRGPHPPMVSAGRSPVRPYDHDGTTGRHPSRPPARRSAGERPTGRSRYRSTPLDRRRGGSR